MFKTFYLETRAYRWEYSIGVRRVSASIFGGPTCVDEADFVTSKLAGDVGMLRRAFLAKVPDEEAVDTCLKQSVGRHGAELFGEEAYTKALALDSARAERLREPFRAVMGG